MLKEGFTCSHGVDFEEEGLFVEDQGKRIHFSSRLGGKIGEEKSGRHGFRKQVGTGASVGKGSAEEHGQAVSYHLLPSPWYPQIFSTSFFLIPFERF